MATGSFRKWWRRGAITPGTHLTVVYLTSSHLNNNRVCPSVIYFFEMGENATVKIERKWWRSTKDRRSTDMRTTHLTAVYPIFLLLHILSVISCLSIHWFVTFFSDSCYRYSQYWVLFNLPIDWSSWFFREKAGYWLVRNGGRERKEEEENL